MSNGESTARNTAASKSLGSRGNQATHQDGPRGSRNKLGEAFLADLYSDWLENGVEAIQRVCRDRPQDYLKIVASILPRDLNVRVNADGVAPAGAGNSVGDHFENLARHNSRQKTRQNTRYSGTVTGVPSFSSPLLCLSGD